MPHVYASVAEANDYITDGGASKYAAESAALVSAKLAGLESVSRLIDAKMERSAFGSGFGPRIGTNRYDGDGGYRLRLQDDLLSVTSITKRASTAASTTTTLVADTDYYLVNGDGFYSPGPYRTLLLHGQGVASFGDGYRVTDIAGTWGERNETRTLTPTTSEALDTSETEIDVSALTDLSAGLTLLLDSEQVYVRATTDSTTDSITVDRAVNGTTAATHLTALAIARYVYHPQVREVALRLFRGRWRARDAGADGTADDLTGALTTPREGEDTIIRRGLYGLRLKETV